MSHGLLEILRYFLLALLWLFFLYAARMALVEVRRSRGGDSGPIEAGGESAAYHLRVMEPADWRGRSFEVNGETTLGRSRACVIPLEYDTFASSVHARVFTRGSELWVEDLGSRNGTFVNSRRLSSPTRLHRGDRVKLGTTVLEIQR